MTISEIHKLFLSCSSVVIDTRKIIPNSFFVALKGERFDANTFAKEALDNGASYVLIDNKDYFIDNRTILVEDCLTALQQLAKYHRAYLNIPIIALTGSNGKTTTKELINVVLSKKYTTKATIGNLNNHIGVPLTLLSFTSVTQIGIVEMGANHQKEIEFLCEIAQPDFGYITNFGKAHLEGFGGVEGVIKGKSEMYNYLKANRKKVFVNLDDAIQMDKTSAMDCITFGQNSASASTFIEQVVANPLVELQFHGLTVKSNLIGLYNANNISAAIAIGSYFSVENVAIKEAIESYIPENNRSQLLTKNSNEIILDAYNANPSSMESGIRSFATLEGKKTLLLGDMLELGTHSSYEHLAIFQLTQELGYSDVYFVGDEFKKALPSYPFVFDTASSLMAWLDTHALDSQYVYIKGSRGIAMEQCLDYFDLS
jgi:UDP-N-acetylmuramoyl-tripeptide--D-alanyl-D-alanine ligase